jgi:hypothetical protein
MILPPPVRAAVTEVAQRLRDPMRECHVDTVGWLVLSAMPTVDARQRHAVLEALRIALGLSLVPGSLARWAKGKSREEVAKALEKVATSEGSERQSGRPHTRREEAMKTLDNLEAEIRHALGINAAGKTPVHHEVLALAVAMEAKDAEIACLRAALKPFAAISRVYLEEMGAARKSDDTRLFGANDAHFTVGDCRAALKALEDK